MKLNKKALQSFRVLLLVILLVCLIINFSNAAPKKGGKGKKGDKNVKDKPKKVTRRNPYQKTMCVPADDTVRAKRRVCLLRPDTGPCRADILAWYYDGKKRECYRFFWGGCQGNGNNFKTKKECEEACFLSTEMEADHVPYYCSLAFDFGTCYGHYNRWTWDNFYKSCRRRIYSGCGGNQNNFETKKECMANCLLKPNNTLNVHETVYTTCIPFQMPDFN